MKDANEFVLQLKWLDSQLVQKIRLPYQEPNLGIEIQDEPDIPEQLAQWLGCLSAQHRESFRKIRSYILGYHERMQESVEKKRIQYGTGKTKLCAEFHFDSKNQVPILFLWLPLPSNKRGIGRLRIWTDGITVSNVGHVLEGLGKMKLEQEWEEIPREKWPRKSLVYNFTNKSNIPVYSHGYLQRITGNIEPKELPSLETFVEIALQKWLEKL